MIGDYYIKYFGVQVFQKNFLELFEHWVFFQLKKHLWFFIWKKNKILSAGGLPFLFSSHWQGKSSLPPASSPSFLPRGARGCSSPSPRLPFCLPFLPFSQNLLRNGIPSISFPPFSPKTPKILWKFFNFEIKPSPFLRTLTLVFRRCGLDPSSCLYKDP